MRKSLPFHLKASPRIFAFAKQLRNEKSTAAERLLWSHLKSKKLEGYKFRFQHPIGRYIADFYCHDKQLVIEIDGGYHFNKEQEFLDEDRTYWLERRGATVMRFTNDEVFEETDIVLNRIREFLLRGEV